MLEKLDCDGMSSEEEGVEKMGNMNIPVFRVKLCVWRAPEMVEYFKFIDREADNPAVRGTKGSRMVPRIQIEEPGTSSAPAGLPRKMYNPVWLNQAESVRPAWVVDELRVSREAFELLSFAIR